MTIRARLTLWYGFVLFASLALCGGLLYQEWVIEPRERAAQKQGPDGTTPLEDLFENILWSAIPASVLGLGGGWLLMRKALAPVSALTDAAERLNERNLGAQLPRSGNGDELDRLAGVFNGMTARLSDSFQRVREFTLRASHELKTPLTIMRGGFETALNESKASGKEREDLLDKLEEIDRLTSIVDGMTLLTKADAGLIANKREPIELDALLADIFADGQVLAEPLGVNIRLEPCARTVVHGDRNRLRQVFLNLVDNALKYNIVGGSVALFLRCQALTAEVVVTNTGPGVPPEMLARVFEPFFRGDSAHSRTVDGTGLGLAIARCIVTAHGGAIAMDSRPGGVTTTTVRLPLAAPQSNGDHA